MGDRTTWRKSNHGLSSALDANCNRPKNCSWSGLCATVDDINPALLKGPQTMGITVYSLLWVLQDLYHQP